MASKAKIAVVGSGGGWKGAFSVGVLEAIEAAQISPAYLSGVSVNAINLGSFVADGFSAAEIKKGWLALESGKRGSNALFDFSFLAITGHLRGSALFSEEGLNNLIYGTRLKNGVRVKGIDARAIVESSARFDVGTHNESRDREYNIFSNRDEQIIANPQIILDAMYCSSALPGFIRPKKINGEVHADGFYPKIEPALNFGCDVVLLVLNDLNRPVDPETIGNEWWPERVLESFEIVHDDKMEDAINDVRKARDNPVSVYAASSPLPFIKRSAIEGLPAPDERPVVIVISPTECFELTTIKFKKGEISRAIKHGFQRTKSIIEALKLA